MDEARRVAIKLVLDGVKVNENINEYIQSFSYTDNEEDNADDLQITIDDRECKWLGEWLKVEAGTKVITTTKTVTKQKQIQYKVKSGDTLWAIAARYLGSGTKYPQIASDNNIKNPNLIYPGQIFVINRNETVNETVKETKEVKEKKVSMVNAVIVQKNWNGDGKDIVMDCGVFEIDSVDAEGPPSKVNIKGTSIPYTSTIRTEKKTKAWEKIKLSDIAKQIANDNGLKCMFESDYNPKYSRKEQMQVSDISFLQSLCKAAGISLKVTAKTIVLFDAAEYEKKTSITTLKYGSSDILTYRFSTNLHDTAYSSCHVSYTNPDTKETIEYTYTPDGEEGTGQTLEVNEKVSSKEEARQLAMKRLRQKNKQEFKASFSVAGDVRLVAGVTVDVKGFQSFDGKYIVSKATHNVTGGYTVDIELRQVLEGY